MKLSRHYVSREKAGVEGRAGYATDVARLRPPYTDVALYTLCLCPGIAADNLMATRRDNGIHL